MATEKQCFEYNKCGYVLWRKERPWAGIQELSDDGDCGIAFETCQRLDPNIPDVPLDHYGPRVDSEMRAAFPEIPNKHGRPCRRLVGGGHT